MALWSKYCEQVNVRAQGQDEGLRQSGSRGKATPTIDDDQKAGDAARALGGGAGGQLSQAVSR